MQKRIRLLVPGTMVIGSMTLNSNEPTPVWNEDILQSKEILEHLRKGTIEIIDEAPGTRRSP
jgi:hypothetical protein